MKETCKKSGLSEPYPEFVARFYDVIYAKVRSAADLDYYLRKIADTKGPVLEAGVGSGRLFIPALRGGADIYGIDISRTMIGVLHSKLNPRERRRVRLGNICSFRHSKKYQLILAPFRVFSHLMTIDEQLQALTNLHRHLPPGGKLIFDLYVPNPKIIQEGFDHFRDFEGEYQPGKKLQRIITSYSDIVRQVTYVTMQFVWDAEDGVTSAEWHFSMRFYFRYELEHLLQRSPFKKFTIFGGFDESPLDTNSTEFVVVCGK